VEECCYYYLINEKILKVFDKVSENLTWLEIGAVIDEPYDFASGYTVLSSL